MNQRNEQKGRFMPYIKIVAVAVLSVLLYRNLHLIIKSSSSTSSRVQVQTSIEIPKDIERRRAYLVQEIAQINTMIEEMPSHSTGLKNRRRALSLELNAMTITQ